MCHHTPACPSAYAYAYAYATDREAAVVVATHHDQDWSRLCNDVLLFDDTGEILPEGTIVAPRRVAAPMAMTVA